MNIKYTGALRDYSGYGEAGRHDVMALRAAGVDISCEIPMYVREFAEFGHIGRAISTMEGRAIPYDIKILHVTPNVYQRYMEVGKYHIARAFWETDKVPDDFAYCINLCNEVWTGSEYNKQALIKGGVTKPIYVIPQAVDTSLDLEHVKPFESDHAGSYKFYSVFEWTERKNPTALIKAYLQEFKPSENVSLTVKTYVDDHSTKHRDEVLQSIEDIKHMTKLKEFPKLYIVSQLFNRDEMYRFHKTHDCFVSTHRGEGWGIPQVEAMLVGNTIISTNCGGVHEYLTNKDNALLLDWKPVPLRANTRNTQWYKADQNWADVDVAEVRDLMRYAFKYHKSFKTGARARKHVLGTFNFERVGKLMLERLEQIK